MTSMTQFNLAPIAALIDGKYKREADLAAAGLSSFTAALRFQEQFAPQDELDEYRRFLQRSHKNQIVRDLEFEAEMRSLQTHANAMNRATGNYWDLKQTRFEQRYWKEAITNEIGFRERLRPFKNKQQKLGKEEISCLAQHKVPERFYRMSSKSAAKELYTHTMGDELKSFGFNLDEDASNREQVTHSKEISRELKLCFVADLKHLTRSVSEPIEDMRTGELIPNGPTLDVLLSLRRLDDNLPHPIAIIMFEWMLPVWEFPLYTHSYVRFSTIEELQSLLYIRLAMYKTVASDLDLAVSNLSCK